MLTLYPIHMRRAGIVALMGIIMALVLLRPSISDAAAGGNNPPTDMACLGWERTTVKLTWKDNDNDEVDYRIEQSVNNGAFAEIATVPANTTVYKVLNVNLGDNLRYRVRGSHTDGSFTGYGPICSKRNILESSTVANNGFRIFYGLEATADECPQIQGNDSCVANTNNPSGVNQFANLASISLEGATDAFQRMGFDRDAAQPSGSGLDKIPVNIFYCDGGGCAWGDSEGVTMGLAPFLLEAPFDLGTRVGDPSAYVITAHETFHLQQLRYGGVVDPADKWVGEGQARTIQDKTCLGDNRLSALCFDDITVGYAGYIPQVNAYLANPNRPINQTDYDAALFWTYLTEKFGNSAPGDATEAGMNLIVEFWKDASANPGRDGIAVLNSTLAKLGTSMRFRDIWKDFAVANYAKNLTGTPVPAKYTYTDMSQPGGTYNPVSLTVSQTLALNQSFLRVGETVRQWGAQYYNFTPDANVPVLDIRISQDSSTNIYYTVLGIKSGGIAYEYNVEARNLSHTLINNAYDAVVIIVAGLENLANYRLSVNGTQPSLSILSPTTTNVARVGSNSAPEKFRVAVQLLGSDGLPLTGIDLANFRFRIGTVDVPTDQVLTSALIQDQEWFVVRAPVQAVAGTYDLTVTYASLFTATQASAVNYVLRTDADNMLLIDTSGSMEGAKLDAAKRAARLYVDSWRTGDRLGVVNFSDSANLAMQLEPWTDSGTNTRQQALTVIENLTDQNNTNIGDSLMLGLSQLQSRGDLAHDWAIVLLSDGKEEGVTPAVNFDTAVGNITGLMTKRPVIHAVAIGPDADGPKMQAAAVATGGTYQFVSAPVVLNAATVSSPDSPNAPAALANPRLDLNARYRYIATSVLGHQQFVTTLGPIADGDEDQDIRTIVVEGSAAEVEISLSFDGLCFCNVELRNPSGNVVNTAEVDPLFRHLLWRVATPQAGNWELRIWEKSGGPKAAVVDAPQVEALPPYLIQGSVKGEITLETDFPLPVAKRVSGVPMPIVASLTEFGPITTAFVAAAVTTPSNQVIFVTLYDDGQHGDGKAADGVYANTFYQTGDAGTNSGAGSYTVNMFANGNTPTAGNFSREQVLGFFIYSSGDDDGDGLANEVEIRYSGDATALDPGMDPDNDSYLTIDELAAGTDPLDPDSDDGGEADGSEIRSGTDPHDPTDDGIPSTWAVAYPGDSKVFVRYALQPSYQTVVIYRSESFSGTYSYVGEVAPTGIFTDSTVVNDKEYCYYVTGEDAYERWSAPLATSCTTPKADPWPPDGGFLINNGASQTDSRNVTLNIFASDAVSPHLEEPDSLNTIMVPPANSATEVTEMRVSNKGDMRGSSYEPFATTKSWRLGQAHGLAMVYMQFRDAAGNESHIVPNSINVNDNSVEEPLTLSVSPASLSFAGKVDGANPAAKPFAIGSSGSGTLNWSASSDVAWATLSDTSGTGGASVTVSINTGGLALGTYTGTITVTADSADGSPQTVALTLVVQDSEPVDEGTNLYLPSARR